MHDRLVRNTALGVPMNLAATQAGIALRTFVDWMQRGRAEDERLAEAAIAGQDTAPEAAERAFLDLYRDVMRARSDAAVRNVGHVQRSAAGGFVTEETVRTYRDEAGRMVTETTTKRAAPDWRAAAWYLERSHRSEFGKDAVQVEVTGADGTPLQIGPVEPAEDLALRVAANIAALLPAPQQIGPGRDEVIVDAEVDDDQPAT